GGQRSIHAAAAAVEALRARGCGRAEQRSQMTCESTHARTSPEAGHAAAMLRAAAGMMQGRGERENVSVRLGQEVCQQQSAVQSAMAWIIL
ncbi:unnamed protein product, partial [Closterium sp. Naga37s-1]